MDGNQQEKDFEWFRDHYQELFETYGSCYLVIKDGAVLGTYRNFTEAIYETERKHKLGSFIIQYCDGKEDAYTSYINQAEREINHGYPRIRRRVVKA